MAIRLFQFSSSPFCAKARKLLDYKGVDYEIIEVDYLERKELILASGQIMVPALRLESGEAVVFSDRIAERLEELFPEPTIFPVGARGLHIALARYIDGEVEDVLYKCAIRDEMEHYRRQGPDRLEFWRYIRERKFGEGFCERMIEETAHNYDRMLSVLRPFEEQLGSGGFLTSRIGLADFSLYGQLTYMTFTGRNKIPVSMTNLRAFYDRMDRISSAPEPG